MTSGSVLPTLLGTAAMLLAGCGPKEVRPAEIFPEDNCSQCRMAISDQSFASEIVTADEVFKFDDIGCLEKFRDGIQPAMIIAAFVKDYDTKEWVRRERAYVVRTGLQTPMGSGLAAFSDSLRALKMLVGHAPPASGGTGEGTQ